MKIDSYPGSEKTYISGTLFPNIKVGMRKINLTPTVSVKDNGEKEVRNNAPIYVYDTSGAKVFLD